MKVCIEAHQCPGFGTIPEGSLWDDDSPYVTDPAMFADVVVDEPAPARKPPVRKFGDKKAATG